MPQGGDHTIVRSFEPGEDWVRDDATEQYYEAPSRRRRKHDLLDQPTPVRRRVPADWQSLH